MHAQLIPHDSDDIMEKQPMALSLVSDQAKQIGDLCEGSDSQRSHIRAADG